MKALVLVLALTLGIIIGARFVPNTARIGKDDVNPAMHCQEDEVIGYNPINPHGLQCVNVESYITN